MKSAVEDAGTLPSSVRIYLFGSACYRQCPSDIDILIVYDADIVSPIDAYSAFRHVTRRIEERVGIHVHQTVLTKAEVEHSRFIEKIEPIELRAT